ncbi:MAG: DUF6164 family protein [Arenicellales bacterium]
MAKKLYALRNVPDDEVEEMRILLREHDIDFHETTAGLLGIGTAALWVNKAEQLETAQQLIFNYQQQRYEQARSDYTDSKLKGEHIRFIDKFKQQPVKISLYVFGALLLLYITASPFWV